MRRMAAALLVIGLLAACGEPAGDAGTTTPSTVPPGTTTTAAAETTSTVPATTTSVETSTTTAAFWTVPGLPEARSPEEIPWDEVGTGWLLVRYRQTAANPDGSEGEVLYLVDPGDVAYAVGEWNGVPILDWSVDRLLFFDGSLQIADLGSGETASLPITFPEGSQVDARFTADGGFIVRVAGDPAASGHVSLNSYAADGSPLAVLADLEVPAYDPADPHAVEGGATWLSAASGEVVLATGAGINLLGSDGAAVRSLDTPGFGCTLARWWDEGSVLAACFDADWAASECWYRAPMPDGRGLWAVPLDGSAATRLTPAPVCGTDQFAPPYWDGLALDGVVAAEMAGCCECGGALDFISGDAVVPWAGYPDSPACSPNLIALRDGSFLVQDTVYGPDAGQGVTGMLGALLEVNPDGSLAGEVFPVTPGDFGGVVQVLDH